MVRIEETLDDATRSRLANLARKAGGGVATLYAVGDRSWNHCCLAVATCAEDAVRLCQRMGFPNWDMSNTVTRRIMRNVDADPGFVTAYRIAHPHTNGR